MKEEMKQEGRSVSDFQDKTGLCQRPKRLKLSTT